MKKRRLGRSDFMVSPMGWGTVKIGRNHQVKNACGDGFALPDDCQLDELIENCLEQGVNLIDTAPAYGLSEARLGSLLKGRRSKFHINTKVGEFFDGKNSSYAFDAKTIVTSIEASLKRLRTDYLDSVLLHCPRDDLDVVTNEETLNALQSLKDSGKVGLVGASVHSLEAAMFAAAHLDLIMLAYNYFFQSLRQAIQEAQQNGVGVLVIKGLQQGNTDGLTPEELIRFVLDTPGVSSLIVGSINSAHLRENFAAGAAAL